MSEHSSDNSVSSQSVSERKAELCSGAPLHAISLVKVVYCDKESEMSGIDGDFSEKDSQE